MPVLESRYGQVPPAGAVGLQGNPRGPNVGPAAVVNTVATPAAGKNFDSRSTSPGPWLNGWGVTSCKNVIMESGAEYVCDPARSTYAIGEFALLVSVRTV